MAIFAMVFTRTPLLGPLARPRTRCRVVQRAVTTTAAQLGGSGIRRLSRHTYHPKVLGGSPDRSQRDLFGAYGHDRREGRVSVAHFPLPGRLGAYPRTSLQGRGRAVTTCVERSVSSPRKLASPCVRATMGRGGAGLTAGARTCKSATAGDERKSCSGGGTRREAAAQSRVSEGTPKDVALRKAARRRAALRPRRFQSDLFG